MNTTKRVNIEFRLIVIFLLALLLASCGSLPKKCRMYTGVQLPKEQVAFLITQAENKGDAKVRIRSVDGKKVTEERWWGHWGATIEIELLPGPHTIGAIYLWYSHSSKGIGEFKLDAKPGHIYLVSAHLYVDRDEGKKWRPVVTEITEKGSAE